MVKLTDGCFCCFTAAMLVPFRRAPTWRFHTKLYKFGWSTFPNNSRMKNRTELNLGIVSRGDWLWNSANFKGLNNSAVSDVERTRHVTLTVHKFIQDGGQYKRSVSEGRRFWSHLDDWEDTEEVEEQCAVIVRNVSWNSGNSESKFRITVLKFAMHRPLDSCKQTKSNKRSRLY